MENFNIALDIILILFSVWMVRVAIRSIGGIVGSAVTTMAFGIIILGFAHILETIMFRYATMLTTDVQEFIHRVVILAAFVLLLYGFMKIQDVSRQLKGS
jgi:Ca2+/Na+ antiporter